MAYGIVTFDTQVVDTNSYDFDGGLLSKLLVLRHDTVEVVISDVVKSEILKHLVVHTKGIIDRLKTANRKALDFGVIDKSLIEELDRSDAETISKGRLYGYLNKLNAKIIPVSDVQISELMTMYFASKPPFGGGKKKNEFPDAVTLLSIEKYAKETGSTVLAISGDPDWASFASESDCIDVVDSIGKALEMLNKQSSAGRVAAGQILDSLDFGEMGALETQLIQQIASEIESVYISPEADSYFEVDSDYMELEVLEISNLDIDSFTLIEASDDLGELVVEIGAEIYVKATASFELSQHDSIDDDYVSIGGASKTVNKNIDVKLMITIINDGKQKEISHVELLKYPSSIDFGEVEPDYSNDYYEE